MCDCGEEGPEAFWKRKPKAKKRHKCSECRGWIEPGEVYTAVRGIWEGEASSFKTCSDCSDLWAWAETMSECFCMSYGQLHASIFDDAHESGNEAYLAGATVKIQAIRTKRRELIAA